MSDVDRAWRETADAFVRFGRTFKDRFDAAKPQEVEEDVTSALDSLTEAVDTAFSAFGESIKDPAVRQTSKEAADALVSALGATVAQLGEALDQAFGRVRETAQPAPPPTDDAED